MRKIIKERGSVYCGKAGWEILNEKVNEFRTSKIFIFTDENTQKFCLPYLLKKTDFEADPEILVIPHGEIHKNIQTCSLLWGQLSEKGADRKSLIINLGGGVITDLGGFVASTFMRGIEFMNIPTSLLGMVDASVGGKNGVDLGVLKNQIGVINNPLFVLVDIEFLKTLPKPHFTSGTAEMLKHGLIYSENYWEEVKNFDNNNQKEAEVLIWKSIEIKSEIVTKDPFETGGRKTLNYGHTLGHAIESHFLESKGKQLLHGEAIAVGMILSTFISNEILGFLLEKLENVTKVILQKFTKQSFTENDIEAIIKLLDFDKKNRNGKVLFVLLNDFGSYKTDCEVSNPLIYKAFEYYKNF